MNILPTKDVEEKDTLLYAGAILLIKLDESSKSVSELWDETKEIDSINTFDRFIATLDMLHILGLIEFQKNKLKKK